LVLHYEEYGDKNSTLMLFLHGGGVSGWMWDKQIQLFHSISLRRARLTRTRAEQ
jgi:pimeloyl-ACP methyl ester carboxylesterase